MQTKQTMKNVHDNITENIQQKSVTTRNNEERLKIYVTTRNNEERL